MEIWDTCQPTDQVQPTEEEDTKEGKEKEENWWRWWRRHIFKVSRKWERSWFWLQRNPGSCWICWFGSDGILEGSLRICDVCEWRVQRWRRKHCFTQRSSWHRNADHGVLLQTWKRISDYSHSYDWDVLSFSATCLIRHRFIENFKNLTNYVIMHANILYCRILNRKSANSPPIGEDGMLVTAMTWGSLWSTEKEKSDASPNPRTSCMTSQSGPLPTRFKHCDWNDIEENVIVWQNDNITLILWYLKTKNL